MACELFPSVGHVASEHQRRLFIYVKHMSQQPLRHANAQLYDVDNTADHFIPSVGLTVGQFAVCRLLKSELDALPAMATDASAS